MTLILIAACRKSTTGAAAVIRRDSAGIAIVENYGDDPASVATWTLDALPAKVIGADGTGETDPFNGISGLLTTSDGGVLVADGSNTIRRYAPTGEIEARFGRAGEGPGEFRGISLLGRIHGDSLIIWDFPLRRLTVLSETGHFGRMPSRPLINGFLFVSRFLADGSLVGFEAEGLDLRETPAGVITPVSALVRYAPGASVPDTLGVFPSGQSFVRGGGRPQVVSIPFAAEPLATSNGMEVCATSSVAFEIRCFGASAHLSRIVRWYKRRTPVDRTLRDGYIARMASRITNEDSRRRLREQFADIPIPDSLPAIGQLAEDADGTLWVGEYSAQSETGTRWNMFDSTGLRIATGRTPSAFRVYQVGSEHLVGVAVDSLGIEQIEFRSIIRPRKANPKEVASSRR